MTKTAKKVTNAPSPSTAEVVETMHTFYAKNGFYRSADLTKVLGDPTKGVSVPLVESGAESCSPRLFWGTSLIAGSTG